MIEPETGVVVVRAAMLGAGTICFGTVATLLLLAPARISPILADYLRHTLRAAAIVLALAALVFLPVQTANATEDWSQATNLSLIYKFATTTQAGHIGFARAVLGLICLLCLGMAQVDRGARLKVGCVTAAIFLASFAASGHAVMHEGAARILHQVNDVVHVLSATFWIGALIALFYAARIIQRHPSSPFSDAAEQMLQRFSTAGVAAVLLVIASGGINTWMILGKVPSDTASTYQMLLVCKIVAVGLMLSCALANRFYFLPQLVRASGRKGLVRSIGLETALGAIVLTLVAVLGSLEPM